MQKRPLIKGILTIIIHIFIKKYKYISKKYKEKCKRLIYHNVGNALNARFL